MDLKEMGINTRNWVVSAQDRDYWKALVNAALDLRVPLAMELVRCLNALRCWVGTGTDLSQSLEPTPHLKQWSELCGQ